MPVNFKYCPLLAHRTFWAHLYGEKLFKRLLYPFLRKVQFPKTEPGRNRKYEQTNYKY